MGAVRNHDSFTNSMRQARPDHSQPGRASNLDILSLEVLEDSIRQFPGAVVIVSHDRYLMDKVCHKILYLDWYFHDRILELCGYR